MPITAVQTRTAALHHNAHYHAHTAHMAFLMHHQIAIASAMIHIARLLALLLRAQSAGTATVVRILLCVYVQAVLIIASLHPA